MIKSIKITKLFDRFNYHLDFNPEGIMIITGPNGYGKSTILKIINSFCNDSFKNILDYRFKKLSIICDTQELVITRNEKSFKIDDISLPYIDNEIIGRRRRPPYLRRINSNEFIDMRTNERIIIDSSISDDDLRNWDDLNTTDRFFLALLDSMLIQSSRSKFSEVISTVKQVIKKINLVKSEIGRVRFIQEQRLIEQRIINEERSYSHTRSEYITVINENAEKLKEELRSIMSKHSSLSSELDSTYIKRLFDVHGVNTDSIDIIQQLQELQNKQNKLKKYGLAEIQNVSYLSTLDTEKLQQFGIELSIYLEDANAKYSVFEPIIKKLDLYESIVNEKLSFKKMELSRSNGITVRSIEGQELTLNAVSSGEQEILVLFYKLIFESDVNLLMIDEPEISLHIAWQKEIMENLKSVVNLNKNIQVIVATHSPQIISHNWDLQIDLGEQYNG